MSFLRLGVQCVVIDDEERVLLSQRGDLNVWNLPGGRVDWRESLEAAAAREVREETGIVVGDIDYHSSQPWPFPSSLMLGFIACAATTDIMLFDNELEDARWFSREDIASGALSLPPPQSISFALIEHWYNQNSSRSLRKEPAARIDTPEQLFKRT